MICKHDKHLVEWNKHPRYYSKFDSTGYAGRCECGARVFDDMDESVFVAEPFEEAVR